MVLPYSGYKTFSKIKLNFWLLMAPNSKFSSEKIFISNLHNCV